MPVLNNLIPMQIILRTSAGSCLFADCPSGWFKSRDKHKLPKLYEILAYSQAFAISIFLSRSWHTNCSNQRRRIKACEIREGFQYWN
jgi:hypothetical protein